MTDAASRAVFLTFVRDNKLTAAYIHAFDLVPGEELALQEFLSMADIEVELLAGDPSWALTEAHDNVLSFVRAAVSFTQALEPGTNLVGIHLDVEPYLLPEWETDRAAIIGQYLALLDAIHQALAGSGLRLTVDIPFWFDTISANYSGSIRPLNQHVQDLTDRVVLMDYRDVAEGDDGIILHAALEMLYATQIKREVVIGVETNDVAPEPEKVTFYEEGEQAMEAALTTVTQTYGESPAFGGIAVHDYLGYARLPAGPRLTQLPPALATTPVTTRPDTPQPILVAPTPSVCTPLGGDVAPSVCVAGISVQINNGAPRPASYDELITLKAGDALGLIGLRYCTSGQALADAVAGEAYLFEHNVESYDKGLFTSSGPRIGVGCGDVGDFQGSWIMIPGQHQVVIALVHYFGDRYEVDDRFFIDLDVVPQEP